MIKVYFLDEVNVFLIPIPIPNVIIKSSTGASSLRNKKGRRIRSRFFHPVAIEIFSSKISLDHLPSFNITEKEFVE